MATSRMLAATASFRLLAGPLGRVRDESETVCSRRQAPVPTGCAKRRRIRSRSGKLLVGTLRRVGLPSAGGCCNAFHRHVWRSHASPASRRRPRTACRARDQGGRRARSTRRYAACRSSACTATSTPHVLAEDRPFADPASLLVVPDHYLLRMLVSQGTDLPSLGVPSRGDGVVETDPREIWRRFCAGWHLFRGTPTRYWLEHELSVVFGVTSHPSEETADALYDHLCDQLAKPDFLPRALFERFGIEVLATTDSPLVDAARPRHPARAGVGRSGGAHLPARRAPARRPHGLARRPSTCWPSAAAWTPARTTASATRCASGGARSWRRGRSRPTTGTSGPTPRRWPRPRRPGSTPRPARAASTRTRRARSPATCCTRWRR